MSNLVKSLKESILSNEAISIAKDYAEVALDTTLSDGFLKEIPIISTISGLYKVGSSIRERHAIQKIAAFLNNLNDIPEKEKEAFIKRLDDEDNSGKLFERLLVVLDKLDDVLKAEMVGNLFRMYIMDIIDKSMFLRCANIIERAYCSDLIKLHIDQKNAFQPKFEDVFDRTTPSEEVEQNLVNLGLLIQKIQTNVDLYGGSGMHTQTINTISPLGKKLAKFIFYDINDPEFRMELDNIKREKSQ